MLRLFQPDYTFRGTLNLNPCLTLNSRSTRFNDNTNMFLHDKYKCISFSICPKCTRKDQKLETMNLNVLNQTVASIRGVI